MDESSPHNGANKGNEYSLTRICKIFQESTFIYLFAKPQRRAKVWDILYINKKSSEQCALFKCIYR